MDSNTIILISIVLFLLTNLFVGLYKGRNVTTIDDYALANRSVGTGVLIITLIATMIGAQYIGSEILATQRAGIIISVSVALGYLWMSFALGWFVFPNMLRFKNCYTMGDIMGNLYGAKAKVITGLFSIFCFVFVIVAQLVAMTQLCNVLQVSKSSLILSVGFIVTFYTVSGGMRAVASTDILQFALVIVGFGSIAYKVLKFEELEGGGLTALYNKINEEYPEKLLLLNHKEFLGRIIAPIYYGIFFFSPPIIQRALMARTRSQVRQTFTGFAVLYIMLHVTLIIIGLGILLRYGSGKLEEPQMFDVMLNFVFNGKTWIKLLLIFILLALIMSTVDSFLNALGITIIQDVLKPLNGKRVLNEIQWIKYSIVFLGVGCTILALLLQSQLDINLINLPLAFYAALIVPFIAGILGLKGSPQSFFYCVLAFLCIAGFLTYQSYTGVFLWDLKAEDPIRWKVYRIVPATLGIISILYPFFMFIVNRRLVVEKIKKPTVGMDAILYKRQNKETFSYLFRHPLLWAQNKMIHYGSQPITIGLLLSVIYLIPIVSGKTPGSEYNLALLSLLYFIGLLLCGFLMIHTVWMRSFKRYFPLFWWLTLMYNLPFSCTMLWLFDPTNTIVVLLLSFSVLVLFLLVDWRAFSVLFSLGTVLAILVELLIHGTKNFSNISIINHAFPAIFGIVGAILVGHFVGKRKEQVDQGRIQQTKTWASAFGHDLGNIFWNILLRHPDSSCPLSVCHILENKFKKIEQEGDKGFFIKEDQYKLLSESAQIVKRDLEECMNQMDVFRKLISKGYVSSDLMVNTTISKVLQDSYETIPYVFKECVKILPQPKNFSIKVHPILMHNVVLNLAKNARYHGSAEEIVLTWDSDKRQLLVKDNGKGIPPHIEPYIFDLYYTTDGQGVGLPFVKMVLEQMGASINFTTSEKGTTFFITFE